MNFKFLVFYDLDIFQNEKRNNPLSARNVCDYIIKNLNNLGHSVEVISPSETKLTKGVYQKRTTTISEKLKITLGPTIGANHKFTRIISIFITRFWFVLYLLKNIKKEDIIIAWHQVPLMEPIMIFRTLTHKRNLFILNVGELYQKVIPEKMSEQRKKREIAFIESADRYILSTFSIKKYVDIHGKKNVELPGIFITHHREEFRNSLFDDSKVHILYSGVINKTKGAFRAVDMMEYLDDNYCLHILGWGQEMNSIDDLENYISTKKMKKSKVIFEGIKTGDEYVNYLLSCHIGLCLQDVNSSYNDSSFPSKILTYLSANLRVVCSNILTVKESCVSDLIYFTNSNIPYEIARVVSSIDLNSNYNSTIFLENLSKNFQMQLNDLIV